MISLKIYNLYLIRQHQNHLTKKTKYEAAIKPS